MEKISSLKTLIHQLDHCKTRKDYVSLANKLDLDEKELSKFAFWDDQQYTRNCIKRTDDYELLLLCWEKNQETPIHCHNGEECWVYMASGKIHEIRYQKDEDDQPYSTNELKMVDSGVSYMNDDMGYHSLANIHNGRSMTLHLYVEPIDECSVYCEDSEKFIFKDLQYYSYQGEVNPESIIEN